MLMKFISKFKFFFFLFFLNNFCLYSQFDLHIKSGINLSSVSISNNADGFDQPSGFVPAFHLGVILNSFLDEEYSIEYGIIYNVKGYKVNSSGINVYNYSTYLELPISLVYKLPSFNDINIKFGSYIAYGLKESIRNSIMKEYVKGKIGNHSEEGDTLKPIDFGLNLGADYHRNKIKFGLNLGYGLLNNRPGGGKGNAVRNVSSQFSIGYLINFKNNEEIKKKQ